MTLLLLPLLLLGACRAQEGPGNKAVGSTPGTAGSPSPATEIQTATLTGLYESGPAPQRSRLCAIESGGSARFGLVHWSSPTESCSGSGTARRSGNMLRLTMEGDEPCTIEARIDGTRVSFPPQLAASCAYYCSRGARLAGATFDKTGGAEADALRAEDLIGDRLCGV